MLTLLKEHWFHKTIMRERLIISQGKKESGNTTHSDYIRSFLRIKVMLILGPPFTACSIFFSQFVIVSNKSPLKINTNYPFLLSILILIRFQFSQRQAYVRTVLCLSWALLMVTLMPTAAISTAIILVHDSTPSCHFPIQISLWLCMLMCVCFSE